MSTSQKPPAAPAPARESVRSSAAPRSVRRRARRRCSGEMRTIAFVTDPAPIHAILAPIGEPTHPPALPPAREPPAWTGDLDAGDVIDPYDQSAGIDPLAEPEPESIFDQRISG